MASSHPEKRGGQRSDEQDEVLDGHVVDEPRRASRRLGVDWQESRYVSALPSPDDLERYKQLLPDSPERLLAAGEREQAHRHEIEKRLVSLDEKAMPRFYQGQTRAHWIALALGLAYLAVMLVAILAGAEIAGIAGAAAGIAAIVWAVRRDPRGPQIEPGPGQEDGDSEQGTDDSEQGTDVELDKPPGERS